MGHQTGTTVLIVSGPPGAGKTTVARAAAGLVPRAVHLESDRFFQFIQSGFIEPWKQGSNAQNALVMRIVGTAAAGYAHAGYFTIIDGIVIPRWFLGPLAEQLASERLRVAYAVLRATKETCFQRASNRDADRLSNTEVLDQLWEEFADLGDLEDHVLTTDHANPDDTAEELVAGLGHKLLLRPSQISR